VIMGYYFMPVRARDDEIVDDFVVWSTYVYGPIARGTRAELTTWWTSMFGSAEAHTLEVAMPFARADIHGSSSSIGDGHWGKTIRIHGYGLLGPAELDRDKLSAFVAAVFPRNTAEHEGDGRGATEIGREVRALVTPFDPAEDPEIDVEVWKIQAAQAVTDFEGGYDADPDLA
jgi:hypothetical protein